MADAIVVNKVDAAGAGDVERVVSEVRTLNPRAPVVRAASPVTLDHPGAVRGRRVLVVEDGPTLTHGGAPHGAGFVAATRAGAAEIVDPRRTATPVLAAVFARYPHLGPVLPALGYDDAQLADFRATLDASGADVVVAGTPLDLAALVRPRTPVVRARYEYADVGEPTLGALVDAFLEKALPEVPQP